ncbi:3,4-dihydroxy-2-butanone-4-phosphate synthase [Methanopyrus sp.]
MEANEEVDLRAVRRALKRGEPVFVFDSEDREGETDMVFWASKVTPDHVAELRRTAGGLICVVIHPEHAREIRLPFLVDVYERADHPLLRATWPHDIPYDERSTFSITVNHRDTFTGVTDEDRALTIRKLAEFFTRDHEDPVREFGEEFRSPGHVHLLRPFDGLLEERRGHTELTAALLELVGLEPKVAVICEMLESGGGALPREDAERVAEERGVPFLTGEVILKAWKGGER